MQDEKWMREALILAKQAADAGEVPVGCVVVCGDEIVGRGCNNRENGKNALHHAEVLAIDDSAFIMISQVSEVNGRGFTLEKIAED